ncbi:MAG: sigma-70 family RNA polymerase sigma factor [Polyangiales bacterium]|nr:sigma-70 family RNA polymerase sigma factor [Sandaracinus sp.]
MKRYDAESDLALMRGVGARSPDAWAEFLARFSASIRRTCRRELGAGDDLEDAVQSVFHEVLVCAPRFEARGSLEGWVFRIARWTAIEHRQQRSVGVPLPPDLVAQETPPRGVPSVVASLDRSRREPVLLHYWLGMTVDETAACLGCSPNTVKSRLKAALRRLRHRYVEEHL